MTLDQLFEHGQEAAKHLFKEQGTIHPMWIAEAENGQIIPIVMEMPARDARDTLSKALKETFRHYKVVRYVSILESWMLSAPPGESPRKDHEGSLEHHPDRREVIMIVAEDINGQERSGVFYILRPEKGKPKLSPIDLFNIDKRSEGRFTRLLNTES